MSAHIGREAIRRAGAYDPDLRPVRVEIGPEAGHAGVVRGTAQGRAGGEDIFGAEFREEEGQRSQLDRGSGGSVGRRVRGADTKGQAARKSKAFTLQSLTGLLATAPSVTIDLARRTLNGIEAPSTEDCNKASEHPSHGTRVVADTLSGHLTRASNHRAFCRRRQLASVGGDKNVALRRRRSKNSVLHRSRGERCHIAICQ